jgi:Methane oxygenase PmoA
MSTFTRPALLSSIVTIVLAAAASAADGDEPPVQFAPGDGKIAVVIDGLPIAVYYYKDAKITRPFFAHVRAPSGVQVTRHHPPIEGQDLMDHDTFHPGIWMSFGDISGSDYWRIKARVRHAGFAEEPKMGLGKGTFAVRNEYLDQKNPSNVVCNEIARYTVFVRPAGYLLAWDSTFSSDKEFYFGDQEEMGIGFRVATPLRVGSKPDDKVPAGNGTIVDAKGRKNEKEIWGNSSDWCDYSGTMAGERVGMTIFCHPANLRPSWFHARDYGMLEANEFGRQAFHKGDASKVVVKPGEKLRIRYGVLIHSNPADSAPDLVAAYQDYLHLADK